MMTHANRPGSPILALTPARVQRCADGGWRNGDYGDIYFQAGEGLGESRFVFLEKTHLPERIAAVWDSARAGSAGATLTVAELGFGTGLNMMLVCRLWREIAAAYSDVAPDLRPRLTLASIEKHPIAKQDLAALHASWPELAAESAALLAHYPFLVRGFHTLALDADIRLLLCLGDVADMLPALELRADAWFLDGFAPSKNPAMWDDSLYAHLWRCSREGASVSTFSSAGHVRRGLAGAGFSVSKVKGYGIKRDMTVAVRAAPEPTPPPHPARLSLPRVAVIGAGIGGASAAFALAERGCHVTVYDRHPHAAAEASGNPVGIIYPKLTVDAAPMGQLYSHAFCYTTALLARLKVSSWTPCGVLKADADDNAHQRTAKLMEAHAYPADFAALHPEGLFFAQGGVIAPPDFVARLLAHPRIRCVYGAAVAPQDISDHDAVVLASANAALSCDAARDLPLRPLRGQIVSLRATPASQALRHAVCHDVYLTPARDGVHYAGATFQKEGPAPQAQDHLSPARDDDNRAIVRALGECLPHFNLNEDTIIAGRASYRATTPDKLPMAGPLDADQNIFIMAGFGAHGLTTAPLCGAILASMLCGDALPVPATLLAHLLPTRFAARAKKRGKT